VEKVNKNSSHGERQISHVGWKRKPDFFIVGAPKCGTTSMYLYLQEHPEIFLPAQKELHQFGTDLAFKHDRSEAHYHSHFKSWGNEKVGGEASVWYLYSKTAAQEIHDFNPAAKIIIMLRNPTDMVHAQHSQAVYVGRETISDFAGALESEEARKKGELPTHPLSPREVFYYREIARYSEQIIRYEQVFGRENLHIILFDDLKSDVNRVYAETLRFLGVDDTFEADLSPKNKNRRYKNKSLHYLVNNPAPWFKQMVTALIPESIWRRTKTKLQKINTSRAPRDPMRPETRKLLNEQYADEVQSLSKYLSRDLSHWSR
jgi:hypothetical protein